MNGRGGASDLKRATAPEHAPPHAQLFFPAATFGPQGNFCAEMQHSENGRFVNEPTAICECCGQRLPEDQSPVAVLRRKAIAGNHPVLPSDEVNTAGAAYLLGLAEQTLRADRAYFGDRVPCRKVGNRARYRLQDLADYLEKGPA